MIKNIIKRIVIALFFGSSFIVNGGEAETSINLSFEATIGAIAITDGGNIALNPPASAVGGQLNFPRTSLYVAAESDIEIRMQTGGWFLVHEGGTKYPLEGSVEVRDIDGTILSTPVINNDDHTVTVIQTFSHTVSDLVSNPVSSTNYSIEIIIDDVRAYGMEQASWPPGNYTATLTFLVAQFL